MPRWVENIITYKDKTDSILLVTLTQRDGVIRTSIQNYIARTYGDQIQDFSLAFTDPSGQACWIAPGCTIKRAFEFARRRLNGSSVVYLRVWPRLCSKFIKTEEDQKVFD
jgi:hypothetical protein